MFEPTEFTGGVFSKTIEGGRVGARIEVTTQGIVADTSDGQRFTLRFAECQLEKGGASGRMIFCRNADRTLTLFCEDRRFPAALAENAGGTLDEQLASMNTAARRESRSRFGWLVGLTLGTAVLLVGGYYGILGLARVSLYALPAEVDREIGKQVGDTMQLEGPVLENAKVDEFVDTMLARLKPHLPQDGFEYEVRVVDAPLVNAFALPGGQIVLYRGLIEDARSPEEVAGVLAHELGHVVRRHGMERLGQQLGVSVGLALLLGETDGVVQQAAQLGRAGALSSYSRRQEEEADAEAIRLLHAADIDPAPFVAMFDRLANQEGDLPGAVAWLSTHPEHAARLESTRQLVAALPEAAYQPLDVDWLAVRRVLKADDAAEDADAEPPAAVPAP